MMESLYIGCVSHSRAFFPAGNVDEYTMRQAELAARREIQIISAEYKKNGWEQAIGSSGTARALAELVEANGFNDAGITHGISRGGLERLKRALIKAENVNRLKLVALKGDRIPVLAGGLSIMIAVFDELGVDYVDTTDGALRLGVHVRPARPFAARGHAHGDGRRFHAPLWRGSRAGWAYRRACR